MKNRDETLNSKKIVNFSQGRQQNKKNLNWQKIIIISIICWFVLASLAAVALNYKLDQNNQKLTQALELGLQDLKQNNNQALEQINQKLAGMSDTVTAATGAIATTDQSLTSAGEESRAEMAKQIEALGKELDSLGASLKILQEKTK